VPSELSATVCLQPGRGAAFRRRGHAARGTHTREQLRTAGLDSGRRVGPARRRPDACAPSPRDPPGTSAPRVSLALVRNARLIIRPGQGDGTAQADRARRPHRPVLLGPNAAPGSAARTRTPTACCMKTREPCRATPGSCRQPDLDCALLLPFAAKRNEKVVGSIPTGGSESDAGLRQRRRRADSTGGQLPG
jgi:hypothetical protein